MSARPIDATRTASSAGMARPNPAAAVRPAAALYRLLVHGVAVPRLLAAGAGASAWLAVMWALGWPQSDPLHTLVGLAAGAGLALACLPRQLGMPWLMVMAGLAMMGWAQAAVGLLPAVLFIFVMVGGLLAPQFASQGRAPVVRLAWALLSAVLLFAAIALLKWAVEPISRGTGGRELSVYPVLLFCLLSGLPGWWLSWLERRHPLRPARWMALANALTWRAGVGLALYVFLTGRVDGLARALWRPMQGTPLEAWAAPLAWGLAVPALLGVGLVVWWVPVWLARAQLRGWLSSRAVGDALATGGVGGLWLTVLWTADLISRSSGLRLRETLDRPFDTHEFSTGVVALMASLAVNLLVRLALGRPVDAEQRALWVMLPREPGPAGLPAVLARRARLLATTWRLGPVTLVAPAADARTLTGAHLVTAQEAGVADALYSAPHLGDEWQRQLPGPRAWRALPVRCRFLNAPAAADWAEAARWVPPQADVVVLLDEGRATAMATTRPTDPAPHAVLAPAQALCRHLPAERSRVWATEAEIAAAASARLPHHTTPNGERKAEELWVTRLADRARGQAAARRRVLLLHGERDTGFAGQILEALRAGRDAQGLPVLAGALPYRDAEGSAVATRGNLTRGFISAVLRDGVLWDLLMADAVGQARRSAGGRWSLGRWLATLGLELASDSRQLDVLVLETGLPDGPARALMPTRSGADRLVALWPAELPPEAPPFYPGDQYHHRLPLPPRSAWHARTAASVAEAVLRGEALPPFGAAPAPRRPPEPDAPPPARPQDASPEVLRAGARLATPEHPAEMPAGEPAAEQASFEEAAAEEVPSEEAPSEQAPSEKAPVEEPPARAEPAAETPLHDLPVVLTIRLTGDSGWLFHLVTPTQRWEGHSRAAPDLVRQLAAPLQAAARIDPELLPALAQLLLPTQPPRLTPEEAQTLLISVNDEAAWLPWEALLHWARWVDDSVPVWRLPQRSAFRARPSGDPREGPWRVAGAKDDHLALSLLAGMLQKYQPHSGRPLPEVPPTLAAHPDDALLQALDEAEQGSLLVFVRSTTGGVPPAGSGPDRRARSRQLSRPAPSAPQLLVLDLRHADLSASPTFSSASPPRLDDETDVTWLVPEGLDALFARGVRCVVCLSGWRPPQGGEQAGLQLLQGLLSGLTIAQALHEVRQRSRSADPAGPTWLQLQGWGDPDWRLPLPLK